MAQRAAIEQPPRMTYEEFRSWAGEEVRAEWVDGEVIELMPPTKRHQRLLLALGFVLEYLVATQRLGEVLTAPFEVRLRSGRSYREPDLLFVSTENLGRLSSERLDGPADLIIEIVSDDSIVRDRREKLVEYQSAGVIEYWIFDPRPDVESLLVYRRESTGLFDLVPADASGRFDSAVIPGFCFDVAWMRPDPLPTGPELLGMILPKFGGPLERER